MVKTSYCIYIFILIFFPVFLYSSWVHFAWRVTCLPVRWTKLSPSLELPVYSETQEGTVMGFKVSEIIPIYVKPSIIFLKKSFLPALLITLQFEITSRGAQREKLALLHSHWWWTMCLWEWGRCVWIRWNCLSCFVSLRGLKKISRPQLWYFEKEALDHLWSFMRQTEIQPGRCKILFNDAKHWHHLFYLGQPSATLWWKLNTALFVPYSVQISSNPGLPKCLLPSLFLAPPHSRPSSAPIFPTSFRLSMFLVLSYRVKT